MEEQTIDELCEHSEQYSQFSKELYLCKKEEYCEEQLSFGKIVYCKMYLQSLKMTEEK